MAPSLVTAVGLAAAGVGWIVARRAQAGAVGALVLLVTAALTGAATWTGLGASTLAGLTAAELALEPRTIHGFSLALPKGEEKAELDNYELGSLTIMRPGGLPGGLEVRWDIGEAMSHEQLKNILLEVTPSLKFIEVTEVKGREAPIETSVFTIKDSLLTVSLRSCGGRNVYLMTTLLGGRDQVLGLHGRVVDSFTCLVADDVRVTTKLLPKITVPEGFGVDESVNDALVLVGLDSSAYGFYRNTKSVAQALATNPNALKAMLTAMSLSDVEVTSGPSQVAAIDGLRPVWRVRASDGEQEVQILATAWVCASSNVGYVALFLGSPDLSTDVPLRTMLAAECVPQGEAPPYPSALSVFEAACAAGDERGCE